MPVKFPQDNESMDCPHCLTKKSAFSNVSGSLSFEFSPPRKTGLLNTFTARYCRVCGGPIILWSYPRKPGGPQEGRVVFPIASTRPTAPELIRKDDSDLANDYDEAVACEPHSLQAVVILLARCASQMLVTKCHGDKKDGLKTQFETALKSKDIPDELAAEVNAITEPRNQVGHVWYDVSGKHLRVNKDDADWWFEIVDWMFEHLYIVPQKRADRITRMQRTKDEKKAGDKT